MTNEERTAILGMVRGHFQLIREVLLLRNVLDAAQQNHEIKDWLSTYHALQSSPGIRDVEAQHAKVLAAFEEKFDEQLVEELAKLRPTGLPN